MKMVGSSQRGIALIIVMVTILFWQCWLAVSLIQ
jgi:hypothetical protein